MKKMIIAFCRGNIARSPFAEAVINRELIKRGLNNQFCAISRGIQGTMVDPIPVKFPNITFYTDLYRDAKPALDKFNIDITSHISKPVDKQTANDACLLLAVDRKTFDGLLTLFPESKSKIHLLSELTGKETDFEDPAEVNGKDKQMQIFSGIEQTITQGFSKLLILANRQ